MYKNEKKSMKEISNYAGSHVDYVQGGGGNTSYKFDVRLMAIKASGYSLLEVEKEKGYVTVDYAAIKSDYAELAEKKDVDIEKETLKINMDSISLLEGMENKRPSVEVGFHSYLKRAVVHTHSVYSNLLCCSEEGRDLAEKIFGGSEYGYVYIPFINPGFRLSMVIEEETRQFQASHGKFPELIFMESHGMIASDDDAEKAIEIHENANNMIKAFFGTAEFPKAKVEPEEIAFSSATEMIKAFVQNGADENYFYSTILYPDQMVYLEANLGKTILINKEKGNITYKMSEKQAQTTEEVILGVVYIISEIKRLGLTLKLLCDEGVDFIRNWESEKYRASLNK